MDLEFSEPVREHYFSLRCVPHSDGVQTVQVDSRYIDPADDLSESMDGFGNCLYSGRCVENHRRFYCEVMGRAQVDQLQRQPEECHGMYRYPTVLTGFSPEIDAFLAKHDTRGKNPFERGCVLMQALYDHFRYQPNTTTIATTAGQALGAGCGVCQDYAHIFIALCRRCGIPARYVAGMMLGEGATHSWAEIHDGRRWIGFDPTHNRFVDDIYIKAAHGRDYRDCSMERGIFVGAASQRQKIYVSVEEEHD